MRTPRRAICLLVLVIFLTEAVPAVSTDNPESRTVASARLATPQLSEEDREIIKMLQLLEEIEFLQDMEIVEAMENAG